MTDMLMEVTIIGTILIAVTVDLGHGCHLDREANSRARRNRRRSEIEKGQPMSVTQRSKRAELASVPRRSSVRKEPAAPRRARPGATKRVL